MLGPPQKAEKTRTLSLRTQPGLGQQLGNGGGVNIEQPGGVGCRLFTGAHQANDLLLLSSRQLGPTSPDAAFLTSGEQPVACVLAQYGVPGKGRLRPLRPVGLALAYDFLRILRRPDADAADWPSRPACAIDRRDRLVEVTMS